MAEPSAAAPMPCCVCHAQNGKPCAGCKSRHYCSRKTGRLLDELMPKKNVKEEPAIVANVAPVDGAPGRVLDSRFTWAFAIFLRIWAAWGALLWRILPENAEPDGAAPEPEAQLHLGQAYERGLKGLEQDSKMAAQLFGRSAAQRRALAQTALGCCYQSSRGVDVDHVTAAKWYRRGADQDFSEAQSYLGKTFYKGTSVA
ncbi:hypothetical protein M885DRAFT_563668 [Pelagophyceae sp. CCMP2097]|nr:hypothetical protein M885DRAFT_563668 [Pelagophyceae sp. CCMP2097]